jgi:hypothetical protein
MWVCGFCNVRLCVGMGFVMCGCVCMWIFQCAGVCIYEFCNVWVCVYVSFVMCGCFDNCVSVLIICVLVFTVFCIICTVFLYCFVYVYLFLSVTSVRTTATE